MEMHMVSDESPIELALRNLGRPVTLTPMPNGWFVDARADQPGAHYEATGPSLAVALRRLQFVVSLTRSR